MERAGFRVGEAKVGEGLEEAHVEVIVGGKEGPAGVAFAVGLALQSRGHTKLFAVLAPNVLVKPVTLIVPKVTIESMKQAELVFGAVQHAIARAVADSVEEGIIPREAADELVIVASVFVHPKASDAERVYRNNYEAMKLAVRRAMGGEPSVDEVLKRKDEVTHPLYRPPPPGSDERR